MLIQLVRQTNSPKPIVNSGELDPGVPGDVDPPHGSLKNSNTKSGLLLFKNIYLN